MKLKHILEASLPDPSAYRAGDESNPRSPHYMGDDEEFTDPSGIDTKRTPEEDRARMETTFDEGRDVAKDGTVTYKAALASQEVANQRIEEIRKGANEVISVNQSSEQTEDGPIFNIEVVYTYGNQSYGDDFQEPDTDY